MEVLISFSFSSGASSSAACPPILCSMLFDPPFPIPAFYVSRVPLPFRFFFSRLPLPMNRTQGQARRSAPIPDTLAFRPSGKNKQAKIDDKQMLKWFWSFWSFCMAVSMGVSEARIFQRRNDWSAAVCSTGHDFREGPNYGFGFIGLLR